MALCSFVFILIFALGSGSGQLPLGRDSGSALNGKKATNTAVQSSPGVSGETHPGADPTKGILLDEGFDGNTLGATTWNTCHWWQDGGCTISSNNELEWYLPQQASVSSGALHLTADRRAVVAPNGKKYSFASGMVTTGPPTHNASPKLAFSYGKVEVRFQLPSGRGLWPAIWLLPASENSRPEIDMLETIGDDTGRLSMHLHPKNRSAQPLGKDYLLPKGQSLAEGWHTVALDWSPGVLSYFLDGKQIWKVTGAQVPAEPMYLVINLAVGGEFPGSPDHNTKFPATMSIDHVRIQRND